MSDARPPGAAARVVAVLGLSLASVVASLVACREDRAGEAVAPVAFDLPTGREQAAERLEWVIRRLAEGEGASDAAYPPCLLQRAWREHQRWREQAGGEPGPDEDLRWLDTLLATAGPVHLRVEREQRRTGSGGARSWTQILRVGTEGLLRESVVVVAVPETGSPGQELSGASRYTVRAGRSLRAVGRAEEHFSPCDLGATLRSFEVTRDLAPGAAVEIVVERGDAWSPIGGDLDALSAQEDLLFPVAVRRAGTTAVRWLRTPIFEAEGGRPARIEVVAPSVVAAGAPSELVVRLLDSSGRAAGGALPPLRVQLGDRELHEAELPTATLSIPLPGLDPGVHRFRVVGGDGLVGWSNPMVVGAGTASEELLWGSGVVVSPVAERGLVLRRLQRLRKDRLDLALVGLLDELGPPLTLAEVGANLPGLGSWLLAEPGDEAFSGGLALLLAAAPGREGRDSSEPAAMLRESFVFEPGRIALSEPRAPDAVAMPRFGGGLQSPGLVAVWAPSAEPSAVAEALDARRFFTTTGARIVLEVAGEEGVAPQAGGPLRRIRGSVRAAAPLEAVIVHRDGEAVWSQRLQQGSLGERSFVRVSVRPEWPPSAGPESRRTPLLGRIRVRGATLIAVGSTALERRGGARLLTDAEAQEARLRAELDGREIALLIELGSAEASSTIVAELATPDPSEAPGEIASRGESSAREHLVPLGRLVDAERPVQIASELLGALGYRLEAALVEARPLLDHEFVFEERNDPATPGVYLVEVRQLDGEAAWSAALFAP